MVRYHLYRKPFIASVFLLCANGLLKCTPAYEIDWIVFFLRYIVQVMNSFSWKHLLHYTCNVSKHLSLKKLLWKSEKTLQLRFNDEVKRTTTGDLKSCVCFCFTKREISNILSLITNKPFVRFSDCLKIPKNYLVQGLI